MRFHSEHSRRITFLAVAGGALAVTGAAAWTCAFSKGGISAFFGTIEAQIGGALAALSCTAAILAVIFAVRRRTNGRNARQETFASLSQIHSEIQTLTDERTAAMRKLQEQDHLLKTILHVLADGVFWKDSQGVYRGCNELFARWMGHDRCEDVIGKTAHQLLTDRAKADFYTRCDNEVMKTGVGLIDMNETVTTASGVRTELRFSKLPLRNVRGEIVGIVGVGADVTRADHVETHKGADLARTIGAMQEGVVLVDAQGIITEANDYYAALTRKPAEILRGRPLSDELTCPADRQLKDILEQFCNAAVRPPAQAFHHCRGDNDFYIRVQPIWRGTRYEGAVINVIDVSELTQARERAEYASYRKGRFLASISHQIRTPLNNIAGFAELLCRQALTPEQTRFVETIASSANEIRDVVEEIVSLSRTHIDEFAEEDRIRRTVKTPTADSESHETATESDPAAPDAQSPTSDNSGEVLIVDDVPENRMLLEVLLKRQGYRTTLCGSGAEAVELAQQNRFDLILMDLQMAQMNGLEATQIIRSAGCNAATPIVAMTASTSNQDQADCLNAGCDDLVRKPIRKEALLRKVWRFMEQQKQMRTADAGGEIVSFLSDNSDYQKTIETFVENLPARIREMQHALDTENLKDLAFKVHILKGLGGFAGFPVYTELARSIEQAINDTQIEDVRRKLDEMVDLCRRTRLARQ